MSAASGLNPSQEEAANHDLGPLLVLAGAGSGKTRVVTTRIGRLLDRGVHAKAILAMTFTNKAASEMLERVTKIVGPKRAKDLTIGTFHRFGLGVLRAEARALGFRGAKFTIFDQADCSGVVREVLREVRSGKGYDIGAILGRISAAKNEFIEPEELEKRGGRIRAGEATEYDEVTALVYPKYVSMMRGFQAFDFDDLLCEVVRLWRRRPEILQKYRERYRYVIVDEYQDTNHAQLELVRLLCEEHRNVCVVGDDDQSIYAWRGADVRNILDFERHFPGAKVVKLQENYRSNAEVLKVASVVLEKSGARRHPKTIVATRAAGAQVEVVVASDAECEARFVARTIDDLVRQGTVRPKECAVLYRSNLQAPDIEAALKERAVPHVVLGGQQFFERKEVKDLLAYLKIVLDPGDEIALRRIINYPARGIGDVALERIGNFATARGSSLWKAVERGREVPELSSAAMDGCESLVILMEEGKARFARGETAGAVLSFLCDAIGLKRDIQAASTSNAAAARRWGNVEGLLKVFTRRDERGQGGPKETLDFLRILALREEGEDDKPKDVVTLTTMHGAKGLEFDQVFVVGLEEGLLPHIRSQTERATDVPSSEHASSLEEERRLFYVAVTRAKEKLYLCRAELRAFRGKLTQRVPSRFLVEIPAEMYVLREEKGAPTENVETTKTGAAGLLAALGDMFGKPSVSGPSS